MAWRNNEMTNAEDVFYMEVKHKLIAHTTMTHSSFLAVRPAWQGLIFQNLWFPFWAWQRCWMGWLQWRRCPGHIRKWWYERMNNNQIMASVFFRPSTLKSLKKVLVSPVKCRALYLKISDCVAKCGLTLTSPHSKPFLSRVAWNIRLIPAS